MKSKTIRKILNHKIKEWTDSIEDVTVRKAALEGTIVTGGAIASMLLGEKVNDYDIYFKDKETAVIVTQYYLNKYIENNDCPLVPTLDSKGDRLRIIVKSAGIEGESIDSDNYKYFEMLPEDDISHDEYVDPVEVEVDTESNSKYRPIFMSSNAITLSGSIQLIIRFYGTSEEIHSNYDFTHCTNWWSSWDQKLELNTDALECLLTRELKYQGSKYPLCSIIRTRKFINRGWTINAGQYLKMCMQLNELDLNDLNVLEDQLTGVDAAYFRQVISYLKDSKKDITSTYLCSIIDKIF